MKSYLINLANARERLNRMVRVFDELDIAFERIDAVQASTVHLHPLYAFLPSPRFQPWTKGQLAALLSHYEVWKRIAEGNEAFSAVFEDDVYLSILLRDLLFGELPAGIDILRLETYAKWKSTYRAIPLARLRGVALHKLYSMHAGAAGYVLSKSAALTLVSRPQFLSGPVDNLLFEPQQLLSRGLRIYQCVPGLVVQDDALSPELRAGGFLASAQALSAPSQVISRRFLERVSRFPRSGARRIERLLIPMATGSIPFAGPLEVVGAESAPNSHL